MDGDTAPTGIDALPINQHVKFDVLQLNHVGISEAKNSASQIATGDVFLFLNDDIQIQPGFVDTHLKAIEQHNYAHAILGHTRWQTFESPTVMDELITSSPMIFFYDGMVPHEQYGFRYAWNLNLSMPRTVFEETSGFANHLRPFMYEDIEFAYRMEKNGHKIIYHPNAEAVHNHRYTWESYLRREIMLGIMAPELWQVNPDCFLEIFKKTLPQLVAEAQQAISIDKKDDQKQYDFLSKELSKSIPGQPDSAYLKSLYLAHLPIKRRAFRYGLIKASLNNDILWKQRPSIAETADIPSCLFEEES